MSAVDIVVGLTLVVLYFRYRGNLSLGGFVLFIEGLIKVLKIVIC